MVPVGADTAPVVLVLTSEVGESNCADLEVPPRPRGDLFLGMLVCPGACSLDQPETLREAAVLLRWIVWWRRRRRWRSTRRSTAGSSPTMCKKRLIRFRRAKTVLALIPAACTRACIARSTNSRIFPSLKTVLRLARVITADSPRLAPRFCRRPSCGLFVVLIAVGRGPGDPGDRARRAGIDVHWLRRPSPSKTQ